MDGRKAGGAIANLFSYLLYSLNSLLHHSHQAPLIIPPSSLPHPFPYGSRTSSAHQATPALPGAQV